jgi:hypothetical protein
MASGPEGPTALTKLARKFTCALAADARQADDGSAARRQSGRDMLAAKGIKLVKSYGD